MSEHPIVVTRGIALPATLAILPARPPHTYLGMARAMVRGLRPLTESADYAIPLAFVSAQVGECALKAFLSRNGDDRRLKNKPLQHSLELMWRAAEIEGLPITLMPPDWLLMLSKLHDAPYYIRYSTGVHGIGVPAPEPMCTELEALVELVAANLARP